MAVHAEPYDRPNVLIIMTDDQGYGDLGATGNPVILTPRLDQLAKEGARLTQFYVSPVCTPTRASLLTGRYHLRTGAIDTYLGRALMRADETTLAEALASAGYQTGIFGKWHLGDNYPLRACDQGFRESLVHRGGGLSQPSGPPGETYFNPELVHNGKPVASRGYCTDIFADAAASFIHENSRRPWFCYLAFNAPHSPLDLPPEDAQPYLDLHLTAGHFPKSGPHPLKIDPEAVAKIYGMVSRIDSAVGRVLDRIDDLGLRERTLVLFLCDNGPATARFNAGLRGQKGSVYEGGIRSPAIVRWPGHVSAHSQISTPMAHIDVMPTVLAACGVETPKEKPLDGQDCLDVFKGRKPGLVQRPLVFQWHRGVEPVRYRNAAVRLGKWKLIQPTGGTGEAFDPSNVRFQLFDLESDPFEERDVAGANPGKVRELRVAYDRWFDEVTRGGYAPVRIVLGSDQENPSTLTRQDWRGTRAGWQDPNIGHWEVTFAHAGEYSLTCRFPQTDRESVLQLRVGELVRDAAVPAGSTSAEIKGLRITEGDTRIEGVLKSKDGDRGVHYVDVERVEKAKGAGSEPR